MQGDAAPPPLAAAAAATVYPDVDAGQVAYLDVLRVAVSVRQSDPSLHCVNVDNSAPSILKRNYQNSTKTSPIDELCHFSARKGPTMPKEHEQNTMVHPNVGAGQVAFLRILRSSGSRASTRPLSSLRSQITLSPKREK